MGRRDRGGHVAGDRGAAPVHQHGFGEGPGGGARGPGRQQRYGSVLGRFRRHGLKSRRQGERRAIGSGQAKRAMAAIHPQPTARLGDQHGVARGFHQALTAGQHLLAGSVGLQNGGHRKGLAGTPAALDVEHQGLAAEPIGRAHLEALLDALRGGEGLDRRTAAVGPAAIRREAEGAVAAAVAIEHVKGGSGIVGIGDAEPACRRDRLAARPDRDAEGTADHRPVVGSADRDRQQSCGRTIRRSEVEAIEHRFAGHEAIEVAVALVGPVAVGCQLEGSEATVLAQGLKHRRRCVRIADRHGPGQSQG